jgi:hypothetical protein
VKTFAKEPLRVFPEALGLVSNDVRGGAPKPYEKQGFFGFVVFWLFVAWLLFRAWPLALVPVVVGAVLFVFNEHIYYMSPRHHSMFYVAVIACGWIALERGEPRRSDAAARAGFTVLFLMQAAMAWHVVKNDRDKELTSAPQVAKFVKQHHEWDGATIIAEPDVFLEPMAYYLPDHPLYVPREGRPFTGRIFFSTRNAPDYTLRELVDSALRIKEETGKPVLLLLGVPVNINGYTHRYPHGRSFSHDPDAYTRFTKSAKLTKEFNNANGDENYTLFVFK